MKLESSRQIFEKYSYIKFHENPSSESRVVPCGQTDKHEANSRFFLAILLMRQKMKQTRKTKQILKGSVDGRITWYLDFI